MLFVRPCIYFVSLFALASSGSGQNEVWKATASDGSTLEHFGNAVAVDGPFALVAAMHDGDNGSKTGAAYMFNRYTGVELFRIDDIAPEPSDIFGFDLAMEGDLVIVGVCHDNELGVNAGAVTVHDTATGALLRTLRASDGDVGDHFGNAVAISGGIAMIGELEDLENGKSSGSAFLFDVNTGAELFKLTPADGSKNDQFGRTVAISGDWAMAGAWKDNMGGGGGADSGSVYVYEVSTGQLLHKLLASDRQPGDLFGHCLAQEGSLALIGAPFADALGSDSGAAYLFDVNSGQELQKLIPSDGQAFDQFGRSAAIDGGVVAVSAPGASVQAGAVYLFDLSTGQELAKITASDGANFDLFGTDVALDSGGLLVGAMNDGDLGLESGSAYMIDLWDGCMSKYCTQLDGSPNNTAVLDASGCDLSSPIFLDLSMAPPGQFTYLLVGSSTGVINDPAGALGDLCLVGGLLSRYRLDMGSTSASGTFSVNISNSNSGGPGFGIPSSGGAAIQAGETWNFQYWFRNAGGAPSGFSEAISVNFE